MKVAYITAGAAGMYCGTCIHDNTVANVLKKQGHDVSLIPTYTPTRTDEENVSMNRIFYGGINVYLQQKLAIFRYTPWVFDRILDNPSLLNSLGRFSASTDARDLGKLTVSMLNAENGKQKKELDKLVKWLKENDKPDIHLWTIDITGHLRLPPDVAVINPGEYATVKITLDTPMALSVSARFDLKKMGVKLGIGVVTAIVE